MELKIGVFEKIEVLESVRSEDGYCDYRVEFVGWIANKTTIGTVVTDVAAVDDYEDGLRFIYCYKLKRNGLTVIDKWFNSLKSSDFSGRGDGPKPWVRD